MVNKNHKTLKEGVSSFKLVSTCFNCGKETIIPISENMEFRIARLRCECGYDMISVRVVLND